MMYFFLFRTPVHRSEKFWRENVQKFDEQNFALLKQLVMCLMASIYNNNKRHIIPFEKN